MAPRFQNLDPDPTLSEFPNLFKLLLGRGRSAWPSQVDWPVTPPPPQRVAGEALRVTFINHATVLIQTAGLNILTDPHFSLRCSPVSWAGPRRAHAPGVAFEDLPPIDLVLLSHNHYDHMDIPSLERLFATHDCALMTGLGVGGHLRPALRPRVTEMAWWETRSFKGLPISFVPVQHFSARGFHDRFETLWGGFVLQTPAGPVYFPGDTAYGSHFRLTRERFGPFKLALLPIGAYEPRWFMKKMHVNPQEAVQAFLDLEASAALGIHFGCFRLTYEAIDAPTTALKQALEEARISSETFRTIAPGNAWEL
ncbi:MAG: MBL fold metallo-hydrolase [candidate division FCPU426 bacterium]